MKHLSHKFAVSLLVTSITLSSVSARAPILEPSVVSSTSVVEQTLDKTEQGLNSPQSIRDTLITCEATIETSLLSTLSTTSKKERSDYKKIYTRLIEKYLTLKREFNTLSDSEKQLKIENAALKMENEKYQNEHQSTWKRFKNWIFGLDATKVTTTLITSLVTIIGTLLIILI